jgi:hypothetical protein
MKRQDFSSAAYPEKLEDLYMKKAVIYILLLSIILTMLISCSEDNYILPDSTVYKGGECCLYNDCVYYLNEGHIEYYSIATGLQKSICFDPLCNHTDDSCIAFCGDTGAFFSFVCEDSGGSYPIIYVSEKRDTQELNLAIERIDVENQKSSFIIENIPNIASQLYIYNSYLYYTAFAPVDGSDSDDYRQEAFRVNINGKEEAELISSEIDSGVNLLNIEDGKVYLYDDFGYLHYYDTYTNSISSYDTLFPFCKTVYDGYVYYYIDNGMQSITEENVEVYDILKKEYVPFQMSVQNYSLYRMELGETDEILIANSLKIGTSLPIYNGCAYILPASYYDTLYNMEMPATCYFTSNQIESVNLSNLAITNIFTNGNWEISSIYDVTDDYILFGGNNIKAQYDAADYNNANSNIVAVLYLIKTGEFVELGHF